MSAKNVKIKKKAVPLFLFLVDQIHLYPSVYFHFHAPDLLKHNYRNEFEHAYYKIYRSVYCI